MVCIQTNNIIADEEIAKQEDGGGCNGGQAASWWPRSDISTCAWMSASNEMDDLAISFACYHRASPNHDSLDRLGACASADVMRLYFHQFQPFRVKGTDERSPPRLGGSWRPWREVCVIHLQLPFKRRLSVPLRSSKVRIFAQWGQGWAAEVGILMEISVVKTRQQRKSDLGYWNLDTDKWVAKFTSSFMLQYIFYNRC